MGLLIHINKATQVLSPGRWPLPIRKYLFPLVYFLIVTGCLYAAFLSWGYDDPYITYRFSENLAQGQGFVYNPGSHILSTTTPLFTLLLSGFQVGWSTIIVPVFGKLLHLQLAFSLPVAANLTDAASLAVGGLCLWVLSITWKSPRVGWTALLLYPAFPLVVTTISSETPLYLALCLAAFAFYARQRYSLTAILVGLAALTRPDGILVALLLAGHFLLSRCRPIPWKAVAIFLALIAVWGIFAWAYFGSPLPTTLVAKQLQSVLPGSETFAAGLITILKWFTAWPYLLALILALSGILYAIRHAPTWLLIPIWALIYFIAYSLLGVGRYFWYYAPLVPGFIVALGLGLTALRVPPALEKTLAVRIPRLKDLNLPVLTRLLSVCLLGLFLYAQVSSLRELRQNPDNRLAIYQVAGQWLNTHTPGQATVGTIETGIIGFYARRPMIDFAGLLYPDVAAQLGAGKSYEDAALYVVRHYQPDYLVLQQSLFPKLVAAYVGEKCQAIQTFTQERYPYPLVIYQCPR